MRSALLVLGLLVDFAAPSQAADTFVTILTGSTSGIYYPLGMALSSIYGKAIKGVSFTVQATNGSVENLRLLESGDGELGFTLADTLANAWIGNNEAGFSAPFIRLRGIARIYPNYVQIVANNQSGIKTLADLKGKRVSVGAEGSGTALNAAAILKAAGLTFGDLATVDHSPFGTSARMVERGELDATIQSAGLGTESIRHLLASGKTTLVPIPSDVVAHIASRVYVIATIPAGTYDEQPAEIPTASIMNALVTREAISEDVVYLMTKSLFDHLDQLVQTHPAAKDIGVAKAPFGLPIPLHPGAERYYREIGLVK
jgi:uncharacterized protein